MIVLSLLATPEEMQWVPRHMVRRSHGGLAGELLDRGIRGTPGTATIAHVDARLAKRRSRSGVNPSMSCGEASLSRPSASIMRNLEVLNNFSGIDIICEL